MHHHRAAQKTIRFQLTFETSPSITRKRFDRGADFVGQRRKKSPVCSTPPTCYAGFDPPVRGLLFCKRTKLGLHASIFVPRLLFAEIEMKTVQEVVHGWRQEHRYHCQKEHTAEQRVTYRKHLGGGC